MVYLHICEFGKDGWMFTPSAQKDPPPRRRFGPDYPQLVKYPSKQVCIQAGEDWLKREISLSPADVMPVYEVVEHKEKALPF